MKNIWLDTDIGSDIDDTMALLLCLRLPDLSLQAVTTVYGQVELRARIARRLLKLVDSQVPVAFGESLPMRSPMPVWHTGEEGKGLLTPSDLQTPPQDLAIGCDGVTALCRAAREHPNQLELVAIGPLTNVARAVQQDAAFRRNVRRIWAMVGGISYPDPPPDRPLLPGEAFLAKPSHNVRCDVAAAKVVLESGIPLMMIGNDVTTRVRIDLDGVAQIEKRQDALSLGVVRLMRVWLDYRSRLFGRPVTWTCLHDALVVAEAYGMAFTECDPVGVELRADGTTVVTCDPDSHIHVARKVRVRDFEQWFLACVARG